MVFLSTTARLSLVAILAISGSLWAAEAPAKNGEAKQTAPKSDAAAEIAREKSKKGASSTTEIRRLMEKERDAMIAEHEALAKELKEATEERKKEIREELEKKKKKFEEVTAAVHKRLRDEQRKQRASVANPPKR
jgi:hypothetical protein